MMPDDQRHTATDANKAPPPPALNASDRGLSIHLYLSPHLQPRCDRRGLKQCAMRKTVMPSLGMAGDAPVLAVGIDAFDFAEHNLPVVRPGGSPFDPDVADDRAYVPVIAAV